MLQSIKRSLLITLVFLTSLSCSQVFQMQSSEISNHMVSADNMVADERITSLYLPYKMQLDKEMDIVIGKTTENLVKGKPESKLTNYLADLMLDESRRVAANNGPTISPDVSFLNYGGIRTAFPEGDITVRKVFELMPFENELVLLELKGSDMQAFLDYVASSGGDCVGGARFVISGERASGVKIDNKELKADETYCLATSDYVADGGDNYSMLKNAVKRINTGEKIRDVIIRYMKRNHMAGQIIQPELDGRITNE
ncbi:MAG TPA: hypothetical protein DCY35_05840 [Prolixibacteraceae bacterium]|nr:hypothetical protein [Prolixibacteraceae bacterium]